MPKNELNSILKMFLFLGVGCCLGFFRVFKKKLGVLQESAI
jgi:hypothetical protein